MKCTYLIASRGISACSALDWPHVPSLLEVGKYCKTIDHRKCPFYLSGINCMKSGREQHKESISIRKRLP